MTSLRLIATAVVILSSIYTVFYTTCLPCICGREEAAIDRRTRSLLAARDPFLETGTDLTTAAVARSNIERLTRCFRYRRFEPSSHMTLAANYLLLHRFNDAVRVYEQALLFDRRPEIYLNLGMAEWASGEHDRGRAHILLACTFAPTMLEAVDPPELSAEVALRVAERDAALRAGSPK